ncbi:disulfide bond formation protein B [Aquabacterium sp. J223]|uniref:disulfide bond formation protein B n=1 Tax=Aquabacterium sp. J223 TaxID=2898431 RepID=UPI0021AD9C60|nr:disulfide bond formation protein B [Aquabacterium sp. J223]UUX95165.1 disulfide bond formation protein B [Aquabacterium sp. J223]
MIGRDKPLLLVGLLLPLAAVAAALVSQHVYGMEPCPWCILQRLLFVLIALWSAVGLLLRRAARGMGALVLLTAAGGVAAALWQHFVAAASQSCNLTWPDRLLAWLQLDALLPEIFQPRASCADAAVSLLGVPYEFWSLALFVALGAVGLALLRRRQP